LPCGLPQRVSSTPTTTFTYLALSSSILLQTYPPKTPEHIAVSRPLTRYKDGEAGSIGSTLFRHWAADRIQTMGSAFARGPGRYVNPSGHGWDNIKPQERFSWEQSDQGNREWTRVLEPFSRHGISKIVHDALLLR
jgi:hypothetical protein